MSKKEEDLGLVDFIMLEYSKSRVKNLNEKIMGLEQMEESWAEGSKMHGDGYDKGFGLFANLKGRKLNKLIDKRMKFQEKINNILEKENDNDFEPDGP